MILTMIFLFSCLQKQANRSQPSCPLKDKVEVKEDKKRNQTRDKSELLESKSIKEDKKILTDFYRALETEDLDSAKSLIDLVLLDTYSLVFMKINSFMYEEAKKRLNSNDRLYKNSYEKVQKLFKNNY